MWKVVSADLGAILQLVLIRELKQVYHVLRGGVKHISNGARSRYTAKVNWKPILAPAARFYDIIVCLIYISRLIWLFDWIQRFGLSLNILMITPLIQLCSMRSSHAFLFQKLRVIPRRSGQLAMADGGQSVVSCRVLLVKDKIVS